MISIASEILNLHPQTLRQYERLGLVVPCRVDGKNRLYSENDIEKLQLIKTLTQKQGVNLAGHQVPPGGDQEDDRADGGDGLGEGVDNTGEKGVSQHGQGNAPEGIAGVRAQDGGGLLNGIVNLQQCGGA